jgi:hypothetical protein
VDRIPVTLDRTNLRVGVNTVRNLLISQVTGVLTKHLCSVALVDGHVCSVLVSQTARELHSPYLAIFLEHVPLDTRMKRTASQTSAPSGRYVALACSTHLRLLTPFLLLRYVKNFARRSSSETLFNASNLTIFVPRCPKGG